MMSMFLTLAQNTSQYNSGVRWVQWGTTGVGVAILMAAAWACFSKPQPDASATQVQIQKITGVVLAVGGASVIAYAWMANSTI